MISNKPLSENISTITWQLLYFVENQFSVRKLDRVKSMCEKLKGR